MTRRSAVLRWLFIVLLIAGACWTANLALYNWWAAGGPPTANPQQFETRGNVFAVVTLLLIGSAIAVGVVNWKRSRRNVGLQS